MPLFKPDAEYHAQYGTENGNQHSACHVARTHMGKHCKRKALRRYAEGESEMRSHKRGCQAWNYSGKVQYTNAGNFHRKDGSRDRCAEKCGEHCAHAGHHNNMGVLFRLAEKMRRVPAQHSAQLQGRALTPGGTAEKMGDGGACKNQRPCGGGNAGGRVNCQQHAVGIRRVQAAFLIKKYYNKAAQRQKPHKKRICLPQPCHKTDTVTKSGTHKPA